MGPQDLKVVIDGDGTLGIAGPSLIGQLTQLKDVASFMCLGLPPSGSWQDLKDHMREAGDVCYADVQKDGMGMVEYLRKEDMEYALRKLDDTKFRSHEVGPHLLLSLYPDHST